MLDRIKSHKVLSKFLNTTCSEEGILIQIDATILPESYIIINPDKYYNSLKIEKRPPSVDCLIVQKCNELSYKITLIELKSISTASNFDLDNLIGRFKNTLSDFISVKFKDLLHKDYQAIDLYFVTNIELYNKRDLGLKLESLISKRFDYNGKKLMLRPKMPIPTIKPCY